MRKTVILGASPNTNRYAYFAAERLEQNGYDFVPIGIRKGEVLGKAILDLKSKPQVLAVDTVTLYIGSNHQAEWEDYVISLQPRRVIFNPGTENPDFASKLRLKGIAAEEACTLVMLASKNY
ncbi:MAG: putative CoA-binding protein [Cyclobacteriaceae bacterium]